jgi:hypothetical protein
MFLRATIRKKDGKLHHYFSVVENKRVRGGRMVQRHVHLLRGVDLPQRHGDIPACGNDPCGVLLI